MQVTVKVQAADGTTKDLTLTVPTGPAVNATVSPGQNINAVLSAQPNGATIGFEPGLYRLTAPLTPKSGQKLVALGSTPVFKGSKVVTGWLKDGTNNRWYKDGLLPAAYTDAGQCEITSGTGANSCQKREQVFLNGVHLNRVMTLAEVVPGSFYEDFTANRVWLGDDPTNKLVEVASTQYAINSTVAGVTLDGLRFQHFATPSQMGAVTIDAPDWVVTRCEFSWNHAIGLHLSDSDRTVVENNKMLYNGQLGMGVHSSVSADVRYNEIAFNNTDGYWGGDWESGGLKITYSNGTDAHHNNIHDNKGVGLWYDIDNVGCEAYENDITNNYADGIRFEISYSGVIRQNRLTGNGIGFATGGGRGSDYSMLATAGININTAADVEVWGNTLVNNANGICAQSRNRGSGTLGAWDLHNLWVHHNEVTQKIGAGYGQGVSGMRMSGIADTAPYYDVAQKNNRFDYNNYHLDSTTASRFGWSQTYMSFATLRTKGQELNGSVSL